MSWPMVAAAFTMHALAVLPEQPDPVTALGIDEFRRGRPHWILNQEGRWQTTVDRGMSDFVTCPQVRGLLG